MPCRGVRARCRVPILIAACYLALCVPGVLHTQALPTARIGLSGRLLAPLDHPATLAVALPPGYGLTALERRTHWPALNDESRVEVPLGRTPFVAEVPPVTYCTHMWLWQRLPPAPPARFILRFSDAPGEDVVWGSQYLVLDAEHHEIRKDIACWRLEIGPLRYRGGLRKDALWLLEVSLTPRRNIQSEHGPQRGGSASSPHLSGTTTRLGALEVGRSSARAEERQVTPHRVNCTGQHGYEHDNTGARLL